MSKHTPGPWSLGTSENHPNFIEAADPLMRGNKNLVAIAEVFEICDDSQHEANAHLIAAAPELLEALILLEREMVLSGNAQSADYGWKPAIEKTRAAIAKAEGRS